MGVFSRPVHTTCVSRKNDIQVVQLVRIMVQYTPAKLVSLLARVQQVKLKKHIKGAGILVVLVGYANCRFWYHPVCLVRNVKIFICTGCSPSPLLLFTNKLWIVLIKGVESKEPINRFLRENNENREAGGKKIIQ